MAARLTLLTWRSHKRFQRRLSESSVDNISPQVVRGVWKCRRWEIVRVNDRDGCWVAQSDEHDAREKAERKEYGEPGGEEEKSYRRAHLALNSNNDLTFPHHQYFPCQECHIKSCHELSYSTSPLWTIYLVIKCVVKWMSIGHT